MTKTEMKKEDEQIISYLVNEFKRDYLDNEYIVNRLYGTIECLKKKGWKEPNKR